MPLSAEFERASSSSYCQSLARSRKRETNNKRCHAACHSFQGLADVLYTPDILLDFVSLVQEQPASNRSSEMVGTMLVQEDDIDELNARPRLP
jgi:hypothetical protein